MDHRGVLFTQAVTNTLATYTVPALKTLILTNIRVDVPTTAGTNSVSLNGAVVHAVTTIGSAVTSKDGMTKIGPVALKPGQAVTHQTSASGVTATLIGYLVDEL